MNLFSDWWNKRKKEKQYEEKSIVERFDDNVAIIENYHIETIKKRELVEEQTKLEFKRGDTVRLRSGGLDMTIEAIVWEKLVCVSITEEWGFLRNTFHKSLLVKVINYNDELVPKK